MSLFEQLKKQAGIILSEHAGAGSTAAGQAVPPDALMGGILETLAQQGLGPLLERLKNKGLGDVVASWVGKGENLPVTPAQMQQGLGPEVIESLAARLGLPPGQASALLSQYLPLIVDKLTPHGTIEGEPSAPGA